ncbi:hypothetical protein C8J26_3176 [Sphingomonas aurantiaca]|uniref:Restriction endonuclease type IV Mrr domain-containing protein n=1 Tax=Sphingomonas aurantiaca TaxID=185949 RepID=A0A2T5GJC9_9SPHN|nr:restriction endonuclease [Sphingomonas aurantiaca]PTQ59426.1 hypothetical protein C8J26_3176 [Sphingomonas aurantiaca]
MAFDPVTLQHLEDALSEAFPYHSGLDAFVSRCGLSATQLKTARDRAEAKNAGSRFDKAPKRFVAQMVIEDLGTAGDAGDRVIAAMITSLTQLPLIGASAAAQAAIAALKVKIKTDQQVKAEQRADRDRAVADAKRTQERAQEEARAARVDKRDALRDRFLTLMQEPNAQSRGYLFETFLNDLFAFEGLDPRKSFKLVGEQIDGAFVWRTRTYLVEAKWTKDSAAGKEFGAFNYKIEGKTADTRGMFISVNGYSPEAITGMNGKGALKFVCLDGAHLMRALSSDDGLPPLLERLWRHADETGEAYLPASRL